jgi:hypothetical protein
VNKRKLCSVVCGFFWDLVLCVRKGLVDRIIGFVVKFQSARRPGRSFERRVNGCRHSVGYRKNWARGIRLWK